MQRFGCGDLGDGVLVIEAFFDALERCFEAEDRLAVLDRGDPARREARAVAQAIDLVDDRAAHVAGPHEVAVHGVDGPIGADRLRGRREGLAEDLAAEDGAPAEILATPAKQIAVERFEAEQIDERCEDWLHVPLVARPTTTARSCARRR